jgi:hypothetical protein
VLIFKIYGEKDFIWQKTIANLVSFRKAKRKMAPAGAREKKRGIAKRDGKLVGKVVFITTFF